MTRHFTSAGFSLFIFIFITMFPQVGFGQRIDTILGCDEIPLSALEAASCTLCNFDILHGNTFPFTASVDAGWCGSVENDQYIGFVVGPTGQVVFEIETYGCSNGNGVQIGIYSADNSPVGDCFNQVFPGQPQIFTGGGLNPGQVYYFRIDGFAGDLCEFKIRVISGLISAGPDAPGPIMGPTDLCWDQSYPYFISPVSNATSYYWRITPGIWTLGVTVDPVEATDPLVGTSFPGIDLEIPPMSLGMPPGTCDEILLNVFPLNPCYASPDSSQFIVTVCRPLQDTVTLEVCSGSQVEFPPGSGEFFGLSTDLVTVELDPGPNGCDTFAVLRTIPLVGQYVDTLDRMGSYAGCESGYVYPPTGQVFGEGLHYFAAADTSGTGSCDTAIALTVTRSGDPFPAVSFSGNGVICDSTTSATAVIQNGVPPFVFEWSTGDRDSATLTSTVDDLYPGTYNLLVTDSLGCTLDTMLVVEDFIEGLPALNIVPTDCNGDGGSAFLTGDNLSSFDFLWSTGVTSSSVTGLSTGLYSLTITLPNTTCQFDTVFTVPVDTLCFSVIEGFVTSDVSFDCTAPRPAFPLGNVEVVLSGSSSRSTFTDHGGYYSFRVDLGTYTVEAVNPDTSLFTPTCTQQHTVTVQNYQAPATRADFYFLRDSLPDIELILHATPASLGRSNTLVARVCNNSSSDQVVDVSMTYDSDKQEVIWTRPTTALVSTNPGSIVFPDIVVPAFGCAPLLAGLRTFNSVSVGDTLTYYGTTDSLTISMDATPANNLDTAQSIVVASYDPNVKLVQPPGQGDSNLIAPTDTLLEYTIIFQNTGSDDALYVRLEDQFLPELNASTFKPIAASHPYRVSLEDDNTLIVVFDDIRLVPMNEDFEGSKGFFTFEIERTAGLPDGTAITNFADIFFDFNDPIRTPLSRVQLPRTNVVEPNVPIDSQRVSNELLLYPNPAHDYFIAQAPTGDSVVSLQLTSVDGHIFPLVFEGGDATKGNQEFRLDNDRIPAGAYFVRIELLAGRIEYRKVVVE